MAEFRIGNDCDTVRQKALAGASSRQHENNAGCFLRQTKSCIRAKTALSNHDPEQPEWGALKPAPPSWQAASATLKLLIASEGPLSFMAQQAPLQTSNLS